MRYTFDQIKKAAEKDNYNKTDCSSPADIYITRHITNCVRAGDKKAAKAYLKKEVLLKK